MEACHHWLYYSDPILLDSDCKGLLDLFKKPLADVENQKIKKILEKAMNYHWETIYIKRDKTCISDALSRLCTRICFDSYKYITPGPRLMRMSKVATVRKKQMEKSNPLVQKIAEDANLDPEYIEMMNYIKTDTYFNDVAPDFELKQMKESRDRMSLATLDGGNRLIVKDETEILIPREQRKQMIETLHFSHWAADSMILQCKCKIYWPGIKQALQKKYEECEACQQNKASQATPHNQVSIDLFQHFMPGQRLQVDYPEKGNGNYLMVVDCLTGFMQAYKTPRKSTEDAIKSIPYWASHWGLPYEIQSNNAACFRQGWEEELGKLGVKVLHSSAYNSQSNGLVERSVRTSKEILAKNGNLSQLILQE